jgi:hypothetical protein
MWYCFNCDKEMRFEQSIVEVQGYVTCGAGKCQKKASKASNVMAMDAIQQKAEQEIKEHESEYHEPILIIVFRTKSPAIQESWIPCPKEEQPPCLADPQQLAGILANGCQFQDTDIADYWYHVMKTEDVAEIIEGAKE